MKSRAVVPLSERFWAKVARGRDDECWNWGAATFKTGYGAIGLGRANEGLGYSHRVAWTLTFGPIPDGLYVLHKCDNRKCCNPSHLFLGSHADNMRDAASKGRLAAQATPECLRRGESHPNSKLTNRAVRLIRALREAGFSYRQMAWLSGVSQHNVASIASGAGWRHVS